MQISCVGWTRAIWRIWSMRHLNLCIWQFHWRKWQTRRNDHDHKTRNAIRRNASSRQNQHKFKWRFFFSISRVVVLSDDNNKNSIYFSSFESFLLSVLQQYVLFFCPMQKVIRTIRVCWSGACMELTRAGHNNKNNNSWKYNNKRKMMTECRQ